MSKKLLVGRRHFGVGDWIMMMSAFKRIHELHPDLNIYIDLGNIPAAKYKFFKGLIYSWDVPVTPVMGGVVTEYDYIMPHVLYPEPSIMYKHHINGMLYMIKAVTELHTEPIVNTARYNGHYDQPLSIRDYVIMPTRCSKSTSYPEKDWGYKRFDVLAKFLTQAGEHVVQVGSKDDPMLTTAEAHLFDLSFEQLATVILRAKYVVALEDGLSHLAGHLGTDCYTLYLMPDITPKHVGYKYQTPIIGTGYISINLVFNTIAQQHNYELLLEEDYEPDIQTT